MTPPTHTLICGCGYVGIALAHELRDAGLAVTALRRNIAALGDLRAVSADLTDAAATRAAFAAAAAHQPLDAIVYTAAADDGTDASYQRAYIDGLKNALAAAAALPSPPQRFIFVSSTSVYEEPHGGLVDETSPANGDSDGSRKILLGESAVLTAPIAHPVVVRFSGIYGPTRNRLIRLVQDNKARCAEGPPQYTNRIHRDDCAAMLKHLLTLDAPQTLYIGSDCEPAVTCEVYRFVASALGLPPPPTISADSPEALAARTQMGRGRSNKRCDNRRILASGFTFRYPTFREGYTALINELRASAT